MLVFLFPGGFSQQEGPSTEQEWEYLLEQLMVRMAEENGWDSPPEEEFSGLFPERGIMETETITGENLLSLLLDENTDMETRLVILETLRQTEDSTVMEEVLRAFLRTEEEAQRPLIRSRNSKPEEPQTRLKMLSRKTTLVEEEEERSGDPEKSRAQWINVLIGSLAIIIAAGFFFMRKGITR